MSTNYLDEKEKWISQAEAARLRDVSRHAILKLVRKGKLRTLEIGGYTLVSKDDVLNFKPGKAGRPKKRG